MRLPNIPIGGAPAANGNGIGGLRHHQKENDGRRLRNRLLIRVGLWLLLGLLAYRALWTYWLAGVGIPDVDVDQRTGRERIRRRPEHLKKFDHIQGRDVPT